MATKIEAKVELFRVEILRPAVVRNFTGISVGDVIELNARDAWDVIGCQPPIARLLPDQPPLRGIGGCLHGAEVGPGLWVPDLH